MVLVVPLAILLLVVLIIYLTKSGVAGANASHGVHLSEVMTSNKGTVPDETGDFPDWFELENTTDQAIDISNYGVSDDRINVTKWTFPAGTVIPPRGYLVVFCSGDTERGRYHTPFKLSADDDLVLTTEGGALIDSIALRGVAAGCTLGRDASGNWGEMRPSPGFPNTEEGADAFLATLTADTAESNGVYINEFMASNASTLLGPDGTYCDWLELYNTTGADIDLSGFGISDNPAQPLRYVLPAGTVIRAYSPLLIYCTGREGISSVDIEVPFGLAAYQEAVVFSTPQGRILDSIEYGRQETDRSMARVPDGTGTWQQTGSPTPGYANNAGGAAQFLSTQSFGSGEIMITEIINGNKSYLLQPDGNYYDWIEICNRSGQTIDLGGWALSNNAKNPAKWVFPSMQLGAGQFLVVLASGRNMTDPSAVLETNFGISGDGDTVLLFSPDARLVDKLQIGRAHTNVSFGRGQDGRVEYYETPTPGTANGPGVSGYAEMPAFSVPSGVYTAAQSVEIRIPSGGVVRYTTDGSIPTQASPAYTGPISVGSGVTVLRARTFIGGLFDSDIASASYFVNQGESTIENHTTTLPIVSLIADPADYFGGAYGIYVAGDKYYEKSGGRDTPTSFEIEHGTISDFAKYANFNAQHITNPDPKGMEWERETHIDYLVDGNLAYSGDVLGRIFGAFSRYERLKGIALIARPGYGDTRMNYKFFEDRDCTSFKSLTLRPSAMDWRFTRMRDILIQGLAEDAGTTLPTQAYVQVVVYINGQYWGVYNLREKVNKYFLAEKYHLADPENMDILVGNGNAPAAEITGNGYLDYQAMVTYAKEHDLSDPSHYAYICSLMDVENFAEYCALEIYVGNTDTGNIKYWRSKQLDNKWRWIPYDFDWALNYDDGTKDVEYTTGWRRDFFTKYFHEKGHGANKGFSTVLSRALLQNDSFRALFLQKCAFMYRAFETEGMIARIDELEANISAEMEFDCARWKDIRYTTWQTRVNRLRESAKNVPEYFLKYVQQYFRLSDSDMNSLFGRKSSV